MKILITGAYGFVGTNLSAFLKERGHTCEALDVKEGAAAYAKFWNWDQLSSIPWADFDAVIHLAGKAHDTKNTTKSDVYFEVNLGLTKKVFEACAGKVKKFIYFSSIKALDGDTPYAQSKRAAEEFLCSQKSATEIIILEPAMIHGPGNKGNLNLLFSVVKRGIPWPLAAFENRRSFTSIGNICAVVEALAARGERFAGVVKFPMCDDEPLSTNRLIELIAESCGKKARLCKVPRGMMKFAAKCGDALHLPLNTERLGKLTEDSVVNNSSVKAALGWKSMPIRAEDGMRSTLKSFKKEG